MAADKEIDMTDNGQLALDTINCTLNMAGYDISTMSQFDKAHALMDMAQELKALASVRQCDAVCTTCEDTLCGNYIPENDDDAETGYVWQL